MKYFSEVMYKFTVWHLSFGSKNFNICLKTPPSLETSRKDIEGTHVCINPNSGEVINEWINEKNEYKKINYDFLNLHANK